MNKTLRYFAINKHLDFIKKLERKEEYCEEDITKTIKYYFNRFNDSLILYGGQTATEHIYGFKKMRSVTNDIDFVCRFSCLKTLANSEKLYYQPDFDVLFTIRNNIPVTFTYKHIHDWKIDRGFYQTALTMNYLECPITCCSPEYSIMLKLLRNKYCIDCKRPLFGKDAIDIINILIAPYFNEALKKIDHQLMHLLIHKYISDDKEVINEILAFIMNHKNHLSKKEVPVFDIHSPEFYALFTGEPG